MIICFRGLNDDSEFLSHIENIILSDIDDLFNQKNQTRIVMGKTNLYSTFVSIILHHTGKYHNKPNKRISTFHSLPDLHYMVLVECVLSGLHLQHPTQIAHRG